MKPVTTLAFATVLVAATASADTLPQPGTRGTVTAYEPDGKTVVLVRACARDRNGAYAYSVCGPALRNEVRTLMCSRGKGAHPWKYQIGDASPMAQVTSCR